MRICSWQKQLMATASHRQRNPGATNDKNIIISSAEGGNCMTSLRHSFKSQNPPRCVLFMASLLELRRA